MDVADYSTTGGQHSSRTVDVARLARIEHVDERRLANQVTIESEGELEAWTCPSCGFTELYVREPGTIPVDGTYVRQLEGQRTRALQARVDYLELALSSMTELLRVRLGVSAEELSLMMQRLDLADGVEDGKIGPDLTREAPSCGQCGRPVNLKREVCLFCNAPVERPVEEASPAAPPARMVRCTLCEALIDERDSYFSDRGLVCSACFKG